MNKEYDAATQAEKLKSMIDGVLRTGDEQVKEIELLQSLVDNAPVEVPEELRSIVADAADAIRDRNKKLKEYITNPKSKVSASDLDLSNTIDDLLERARNFATSVNKAEDDDSSSDEDMKLLERSIKMNREQLEQMHDTLDIVRKFGCPSVDDPDKFIDTLENLVVALQSRVDDLEMCKSLPVEQWPDVESMIPYYMDIIKSAGPELGRAMAEALCMPDIAELPTEDDEEDDEEKCRKIEASICNGKLSVATEGFLPDEHGRIERFLAREFGFELEQDEQEADGIFAEADKEHLSRIGSFFARERDARDVIVDMEREFAAHMNSAGFVGVPYLVDNTKYLAELPLDVALKFWDDPENVKTIQAVLRAVID